MSKNNRFTAKEIEKLKAEYVQKPIIRKVRKKDGTVVKKKLPLMFSPASWKQDQFKKSRADIVIYGGSLGGGKALRHGTKVLTIKGWVPIEDIKIGDKVYTPTEGYQEVTGVFPQGVVDIYKVETQDGSTVETCGEHLWEIRQSGTKKSKIVNTLEIKKIIEKEKVKKGTKNWPLIPLSGEVDFKKEVVLPLHPYVLGVMLGDGAMSGLSTCLSTSDDYIKSRFEELGFPLTKLTHGKYDYYVKGLQKETRDLEVRKTSYYKEIPSLYLEASIDERYELLKGLMDADGYVSKEGKCYFTTVSEKMVDQVAYLVRSLGGTATKTSKVPTYHHKGEKKEGVKAYTLFIRHPNKTKIVSLPRKLERLKKDKLVSNRIKSVEYTCKDEATCISISGSRKLFVIDNFIVTHNTHNALVKLLMGVNDKNFVAMIIRKQMNVMTRVGGIVGEAKKLYKLYSPKVKYNNTKNFFTFPSGAQIGFTQVSTDADAEGLRGAQWSMVLCDESTELDESHVFQIQSRIRSDAVDSDAPRQLILTCNPNPDSYLRKWVDWWLIPEGQENAGRPDPEKECAIRYFIRRDGVMYWADTEEELNEMFPPENDQDKPVSVQFIAATIYDNPPLIKNNPKYLANLKSLPKVKQERDLYGNWNIREEGSCYWKSQWCKELTTYPARMEFEEIVRAYDFACTLPNASNRDPDYFASVKVGRLKDKKGYVILDVFRTRIQSGEWMQTIISAAENDEQGTLILIPQEPSVQAKDNVRRMIFDISREGFRARAVSTSKKKLERFKTFADLSQNGFVMYMRDCGNSYDHINGEKKHVSVNNNDFWISELESFDGTGKKGHDDIADCCSDAFIHLGLKRRFESGILSGLQGMNLGSTSSLLKI